MNILQKKIDYLREKLGAPRQPTYDDLEDRVSQIKAEIEFLNFKLGRSTSPNDRKYDHQSVSSESLLQPSQDERSKHDSASRLKSSLQSSQTQPSKPLSEQFRKALYQATE